MPAGPKFPLPALFNLADAIIPISSLDNLDLDTVARQCEAVALVDALVVIRVLKVNVVITVRDVRRTRGPGPYGEVLALPAGAQTGRDREVIRVGDPDFVSAD